MKRDAGDPSIASIEAARTARRPSRGFLAAVSALLAAAGAYAVFERVGTRANVDRIEYVRNYAGGFLAIGMTDQQPGVLVLSVLDRSSVRIEAVTRNNAVTGRATAVSITAPGGTWRKRLRRPQVITIDKAGELRASELAWSHQRFEAIRTNLDCSAPSHQHARCGAPFANLAERLGEPADSPTPTILAEFLVPYASSAKPVPDPYASSVKPVPDVHKTNPIAVD